MLDYIFERKNLRENNLVRKITLKIQIAYLLVIEHAI